MTAEEVIDYCNGDRTCRTQRDPPCGGGFSLVTDHYQCDLHFPSRATRFVASASACPYRDLMDYLTDIYRRLASPTMYPIVGVRGR
jgi:hypothetical protein